MFFWKAVTSTPRRVATAVMVFGGLLIYAINFPGSMEDDSFVQLLEGRTMSYSNWHPPVMSWLLGVSDGLTGPAAAWFVGFTMLLAFGAFTIAIWLPKRVSWAAVAGGTLMLFLPQLFLLQATVWKDGLFANAVLASFVAIGLAAKHWLVPWRRWTSLALSASLLALAILTRQNGIVVLPCAAVTLGWIAAQGPGKKLYRGLLYAAAYFVVASGLALLANGALQLRADDYPARQEQFKILELYDITGLIYRDLDLPLSVLEEEAPKLARIIRTEGVARWSPLKNDTLEMSPRIVAALDATPPDVLARQWRELVYHYPGKYLAVRALLFRWVFQPPDVRLCHPFHVGDQGDPEDLNALGMTPRLDRRDVALWQVGDGFQKTPVFSHGLFSIAAVIVLVPLLRRRAPTDLAMAGLIASAFVFTATFLFISIACDYRYLYIIDLSALAGALYVAADWRALLQKRGPGGPLS